MQQAKQLFAQGKFPEALAAMEGVPDSTESLAVRARILAGLQKFEESFQAASAALAMDNTNLSAHSTVAGLFILGGRPQDAVPHLDYGLSLTPDDVKFLNNRAKAMIALGRPSEALVHIERLEQLGHASLAANLRQDLSQAPA